MNQLTIREFSIWTQREKPSPPMSTGLGLSTKGNGKGDFETGLELRFGQMELHTKETGFLGKLMGSGSSNILPEIYTRENGDTTRQTVTDHISTKTGQFTKVSGKMTSNMDLGRKYGWTSQNTKEATN